jgi:ureidoacrylate peracid hydrolase
LVIIDPQECFCAGKRETPAGPIGGDVSGIQAAVQRLNPFIQKAREIGMMVVWTRSVLAAGKIRPSHRFRRSSTGDIPIAREGSDGVNWYSGIVKPLPNEYIITKRHYDAFEDTELDLLLQSNGIKTLILTGFTTNVCVETTARHGYIKGYWIILVSDCTDAPTQREYESAIFNIEKYFGKVATSSEIVETWETK